MTKIIKGTDEIPQKFNDEVEQDVITKTIGEWATSMNIRLLDEKFYEDKNDFPYIIMEHQAPLYRFIASTRLPEAIVSIAAEALFKASKKRSCSSFGIRPSTHSTKGNPAGGFPTPIFILGKTSVPS